MIVQNPPAIAITAMLPSQSQFTVDQTKPIKVRMVVSNTGGAGATFTAASMRFIHAGQDRTGQYVISTPSTFRNGSLLLPGEVDTVDLQCLPDNTGNSTEAPGNMTIEGATSPGESSEPFRNVKNIEIKTGVRS